MNLAHLDRHPVWRDELIADLRMRDVSGDRIGAILVEIDEQLRESGKAPERVFGSPADVARDRVPVDQSDDDEDDRSILLIIGVSFVSVAVMFTSAIAAGEDRELWGISPWIPLIASAVVVVVGVLRLPEDVIRDPRSGARLQGPPTAARSILFAIVAFTVLAGFSFGRMLS